MKIAGMLLLAVALCGLSSCSFFQKKRPTTSFSGGMMLPGAGPNLKGSGINLGGDSQ